MSTSQLAPAPLPARLGALFIDLAVPALLSFLAGVGSWVGVNLLWSALIHGGGLAVVPAELARAVFAPSVFGGTAIGMLGPVIVWVLLELGMVANEGRTWGQREQGLVVVKEPLTARRTVVRG